MNAPDKIYINNYNGNDTFGNQWHSKQSASPSVVSHEYIRKDALLEWAKEQASSVEKLNGRGAMLKAWDSLIDKIESL